MFSPLTVEPLFSLAITGSVNVTCFFCLWRCRTETFTPLAWRVLHVRPDQSSLLTSQRLQLFDVCTWTLLWNAVGWKFLKVDRHCWSWSFWLTSLCPTVSYQGPIYAHGEGPAPIPPQGMLVQPEMHIPHPGLHPHQSGGPIANPALYGGPPVSLSPGQPQQLLPPPFYPPPGVMTFPYPTMYPSPQGQSQVTYGGVTYYDTMQQQAQPKPSPPRRTSQPVTIKPPPPEVHFASEWPRPSPLPATQSQPQSDPKSTGVRWNRNHHHHGGRDGWTDGRREAHGLCRWLTASLVEYDFSFFFSPPPPPRFQPCSQSAMLATRHSRTVVQLCSRWFDPPHRLPVGLMSSNPLEPLWSI